MSLESQKDWIKSVIMFVDWNHLNDYEMKFLESMEKWNNDGKLLTDKQMETLDKIYWKGVK